MRAHWRGECCPHSVRWRSARRHQDELRGCPTRSCLPELPRLPSAEVSADYRWQTFLHECLWGNKESPASATLRACRRLLRVALLHITRGGTFRPNLLAPLL